MRAFPNRLLLSAVSVMTVLTMGAAGQSVAAEKAKICDFEDSETGSLPKEWRIGVTNADRLPVWRVEKREDAPSGTHVLAMLKPAVRGGLFGIGSVFNLCYCPSVSVENPKASVMFLSVSGEEDRGGGIMWRVKDENNYYVVRYNPLEENFRLYYVKKGKRVMIAGAKAKPAKGRWHTMSIVQNGDRYECYLDGEKLLSGRDSHIEGAGAVGLWTKADAVTLFDDFKLYSRKGEE